MLEKYDVIIIGAGPAGLSAALYASRANLSVVVLEKEEKGSLLMAHKISNYPGVIGEPTGKELYKNMKEQAIKFGTKIVNATFLELDVMSEYKLVKTDLNNYEADVIIMANGVSKTNNIKIKGEEEFLGRGVSYCATCDGAFFRNMDVSVFGQGDEAVEEALFLTKHAKKVYFFVKDSELKCEKELYDTITQNEKVEILCNRELKKITGKEFVEEVIVEEKGVKKYEDYKVAAAFLYLGTKSNSQLFSMFAKLDENGYIETNEKMETLIKGIYAVGDIRKKVLRQVVTAAADGAIAGTEAIKYMMKHKKDRRN